MTYIVRSKGKRLIGDSIANFDDDELTFLGADLAHVWYSDEVADEDIDKGNTYSIALFFWWGKAPSTFILFFRYE